MAGSFVGASKQDTSKNREIGGVLALDGCRLVKKATIYKQLAERIEGMMERECSWGGVYKGGVVSSCGAAN
jgi:hypothetical protein